MNAKPNIPLVDESDVRQNLEQSYIHDIQLIPKDDVINNENIEEIEHIKTGIKYLLSKGYLRHDIVTNNGNKGKADITTKPDNQDWEIKMLTRNKIVFTHNQILYMKPDTKILLFSEDPTEQPTTLWFKDVISGKYDYNIIVSAMLTLKEFNKIILDITNRDMVKRICENEPSKFIIYKKLMLKYLDFDGTYNLSQLQKDLEQNFITHEDSTDWFLIVQREYIQYDEDKFYKNIQKDILPLTSEELNDISRYDRYNKRIFR